MKRKTVSAKKFRNLILLSLFLSAVAVAATIVINTSGSLYRNISNVVGTSIRSIGDIRIAGATQVAAVYRNANGGIFGGALKKGDKFKIVWPDGSSETIEVVSPTSTVGAVPVPGTQKSGGGGNGGGAPLPGTGGGFGGLPPSGCYGNCEGTVEVGEPEQERG